MGNCTHIGLEAPEAGLVLLEAWRIDSPEVAAHTVAGVDSPAVAGTHSYLADQMAAAGSSDLAARNNFQALDCLAAAGAHLGGTAGADRAVK